MTWRTSRTPALTAESSTNLRPDDLAIAWASVVLPVPGGPHRMTETDPDSPVRSPASATSGDPGVSRCRCPATSSRLVGRMRTASGVAPERSPGLVSTMRQA